MGSFLVQCGTSKQAIYEGDKCYVAVITEQLKPMVTSLDSTPGSFVHVPDVDGCGIADSWSLLSPYLECFYRDYGEFEVIDTPKNRLILASLLPIVKRKGRMAVSAHASDLVEHQNKKLEYDALVRNEWEFEHPALSSSDAIFIEMSNAWSKLNNLISHACIIQKDRLFGYDARLALTVINGHAYDDMKDMGKNWTNYRGYQPLNTDNVVESLVNIAGRRSDAGAVSADVDLADVPFDAVNQYKVYDFMDQIYRRQISVSVSECFVDYMVEVLSSYAVGSVALQELTDLADMVTSDAAVLGAMSLMKTPIVPMFTVGQDYDNECGQTYSMFVSRVSKKNITPDNGW